MSRATQHDRPSRLVTVARVLLLLLIALPLLIAFSAAFRTKTDLLLSGSSLSWRTFLPDNPTLDNLAAVLGLGTFRRQLLNTVAFSGAQATLSAVVSLLAGYAFARCRLPGRRLLFGVLVASAFLPITVILLPMYLTVRDLGLLGTGWALTLPFAFSPIGMFLVRQAVLDLPRSLEEAVFVDGGGLPRVLWNVVLPGCRAAVVTVWVFSFLGAFNQFLWPLVNSQDPNRQFVQVGIAGFFTNQVPDYERIFAASAITALPVIALFLVAQRYYAQSLASTGMK